MAGRLSKFVGRCAVTPSANARFPSLLPLHPANIPQLHIDTSLHSADEVVEQVNAFLHL